MPRSEYKLNITKEELLEKLKTSSLRKIAGELGVNTSTISRKVKREGIKLEQNVVRQDYYKAIVKAQEIRKKFKLKVPIDLEALCENMGIVVKRTELPKSISGIIEDAKTIFINKSHKPTRQNFTIAHELGHILFY